MKTIDVVKTRYGFRDAYGENRYEILPGEPVINDLVLIEIIEDPDSKKLVKTAIIGLLTKISAKDEYPEVLIDGKNVDLCSEGHTSQIYKVCQKRN